MARSTDLAHLHPVLRASLPELDRRIAEKKLPMGLYEAGRGPRRQVALFAAGKTRAHAWDSFHQYGLAVDYVFWIDGVPRWEEPAPGMWAAYRQILLSVGLHPLSFEQPHAELLFSLADVLAGRLPPGDDSWRDWLATEAELWGVDRRVFDGVAHRGAPRWCFDLGERPAVEGGPVG